MKFLTRYFSIYLFGLILPFYAAGQSDKIKSDFKLNNAKFIYYLNKDNKDSTLLYLNKNEALVKQIKDEGLMQYVNFYRAQYFRLISDYPLVYKYALLSNNYFHQIKDVPFEIESGYLLCDYFHSVSQYDSVLFYCNKYLPLTLKTNDTKSYVSLNLLKGRALLTQGENENAATIYRETLSYAEKKKDTLNIYQTLISLASVYLDMNTDIALEYLNKASKISYKFNAQTKSGLYTYYGNAYNNKGMQDSALYYYKLNLSLLDKNLNKIQYAGMIGNIANVYSEMGKNEEALKYQFESLKIFMEGGDSLDVEIAYGSIADIFLALGKFKDALKYYNIAVKMSERLGLLEEIIYNYKGLYTCYEKMGNYKEAHENYKKYNLFRDSINNVETAKKLTEQEMNFKFETQRKEEALIQKNKDILMEAKIRTQKFTIYTAIFGGIILLVFLFITLKNSNARKKINAELQRSHSEINQQKNIIEHKNREITDSIMYASRIQQGILPDTEEIKSLLPDSFLFYRPRDIVSGDFYWMKSLKGSNKIGFDELVGVVVADCTGHGVPGAFMSFIGSTILNQTLNNKKVESPASALNYLNEQLPLTLKSKIKTGQINDGMEAGICVINKTNNKLHFAGANLNLIHIRKGVVNEIKGDKHSIGLNVEQQKTFTDNEISLEKGDCIYMFSDGYPDQFGGEKGKKYKYKNLLNFLNANSNLSADEQLQKLADNFNTWKGNLEQLDDVLLFGVKV